MLVTKAMARLMPSSAIRLSVSGSNGAEFLLPQYTGNRGPFAAVAAPRLR